MVLDQQAIEKGCYLLELGRHVEIVPKIIARVVAALHDKMII
jgi:hypothetical protein